MATLLKAGGSAGETASLTFTDAGVLSLVDSSGGAGDISADVLSDGMLVATITAAGGSGGATAGTLAIDFKRTDNATDPASVRQFAVIVTAGQYSPVQPLKSTVTFSSATAGAIVDSGNGYLLGQTDATGNFACTISNSADETVYVRAISAWGVSALAEACIVVGSTSAAATWAA